MEKLALASASIQAIAVAVAVMVVRSSSARSRIVAALLTGIGASVAGWWILVNGISDAEIFDALASAANWILYLGLGVGMAYFIWRVFRSGSAKFTWRQSGRYENWKKIKAYRRV